MSQEHLVAEEAVEPRGYADQMRAIKESFWDRVPEMGEEEFFQFWGFCIRSIAADLHDDRDSNFQFEKQLLELVACGDEYLDALVDTFHQEQAPILERLKKISTDCIALCDSKFFKYPDVESQSFIVLPAPFQSEPTPES